MKQYQRDFLISLVLANFVLFQDWRYLLGRMSYFASPQPFRVVAIIFCGLVFAAVFTGGIWLARRSGNVGHWVAKWLFVQIIVSGVCIVLRGYLSDRVFIFIMVVVPVLLVAHPAVPRAVATCLLVLSPCVAFLYARGIWEVSRVSHPEVIQGSVNRLSAPGPRVLLLVFDGMGEYVAFTRRPPGVQMPAFDRLRREAFVAEAAYPPADTTLVSMPALLTGNAVVDVRPSHNRLRLHYSAEKRFQSMAQSSTIFSEAHELGFGTAMIGWYHPYCSILRDLDYCAHIEADIEDERYRRGGFMSKALDVIDALPLLHRTSFAQQRNAQAGRESHEYETDFLIRTTHEVLPKFQSGLMVVHLPIPHPPALQGVYFSNLIEADNELGKIREIMEKAGTWEDTTVLITADHWWRTRTWDSPWPGFSWTGDELAYLHADEDKRVPLIAKLPRQKNGASYTTDFNTLILSRMIHDCLTGEIMTAKDLRVWINRNRSNAPVHAYFHKAEP